MAMHDGMSTFFIVTTSDLIGLDSKTAKKLRFKVYCISSDFWKVSSHLRPNPTTYNFLKEIVYVELYQSSKIISYCLLLFWLVALEHFIKFISHKWIFFIFILKYNHGPSAHPLSLKSKIFCEKEPMPQNNEVYGSSYVEHHLKLVIKFILENDINFFQCMTKVWS